MKMLTASILALGLLGATAVSAEVGGGVPFDGARFAAMHQTICSIRYARAVGVVAFLETGLALTDSQRPAFERWKSAILTSAKAGEQACLAVPDMDHAPTILDRQGWTERRLKLQLDALEAQMPALQALYQVLTPEQKLLLDRPRHHGRHGGGRMH